MTREAPTDPTVAAAFDACAPAQRAALLALRGLILETAAETPGVGPLIETLKWGEPAYLPAKARVGTTVRINALKGSADGYALFVHCQTRLMESYRHLYPDSFVFEGDRALLFSTAQAVPEAALKHCVALALTYHLGKQVPRGATASSPAATRA
jgi:hypothetical protein